MAGTTLGKSRVAGKSRKAVSFDETNIANTSVKQDDDLGVIIGAAARKRCKLDAADSERDDADLQDSSESDSHESDSENEESDSDGGDKPVMNKRNKSRVVEGEEKDTLISYNGVRITPFNMRDELDEGEIDSGGNFVYSREKLRKARLTTDNWLDSLDYISLPDTVQARSDAKAKSKSGTKEDGKDGNESAENTDAHNPADGEEENEGSESHLDQASIMQELVNLLDAENANETLLLAIKRCGRSVQRGPKSKAKSKTDNEGETDKDPSKKQLLRLTELADTLMSQFGMTNAYDLTRRDVQSWLFTHTSSGSDSAGAGALADVDADMFSDAFEEPPKPERQPQPTSAAERKWELPEVAWELKWSGASEGTVYGLFSSVQMDGWLTAGYFATRPDCDALVRKVDTRSLRTAFERRFGTSDSRDEQPISVNGNDLTEEQLIALTNGTAQLECGIGSGPFYNVKRMDFSLYTD